MVSVTVLPSTATPVGEAAMVPATTLKSVLPGTASAFSASL